MTCNVGGFVKSRSTHRIRPFIDTATRHDMERQCQRVIQLSLVSLPCPVSLPPSDNGIYNTHSPIRALMLMQSSDPCRPHAYHACRQLTLTVAIPHAVHLLPPADAAPLPRRRVASARPLCAAVAPEQQQQIQGDQRSGAWIPRERSKQMLRECTVTRSLFMDESGITNTVSFAIQRIRLTAEHHKLNNPPSKKKLLCMESLEMCPDYYR